MDSITVRNDGMKTILTVEDKSLSRETAAELKEKALSAIESGSRNIVLDLSLPRYIDSSGIGKILFLSKKLQTLQGELTIPKINPTLYEFLDSLAISKVIEITAP